MTTSTSTTTNNDAANNNSWALRLHAIINYLEPSQRAFATSLAAWILDKKQSSWSEKQFYWVKKLVEEGEAVKQAAKEGIKEAEPKLFPNIIKLFRSNSKLAYLLNPKITYKLAENKPTVTLFFNPRHNCIQAKLDGQKLIATIRIPSGEEDMRWPIKQQYLELLQEIEKDPVQAAILTGKLTSCCSFCSRPLTDERSVKHGYGPICAANWNLPWDAERDGSTKVVEQL